MNRKQKSQQEPSLEQIWLKIEAVQMKLQTSGEWPAEADRLLELVIDSSPPILDEDEKMLSLVVDDVLKGIDIRTRYPAFFNKLMADSALQEAFLDVLTLMVEGEEEGLAPPPMLSPNLDFLRKPTAQPEIKWSKDHWQVVWQQTIAYLQSVFFPQESGMAFRGDDLFEDPWFVLLRGEASIEDTQLSFMLEASQVKERSDLLNIALSIAVNTPPSDQLVALYANLKWGNYDETERINQQGRVNFPPLRLQSILDEQLKSLRADLLLTVEPEVL